MTKKVSRTPKFGFSQLLATPEQPMF